MELSSETPDGERLKEFTKVFWDAFEPLEADMILPMIFPAGLTPEVYERMEQTKGQRMKTDPQMFFITVKDQATGRLAGVSSWGVEPSSPKTLEEVDNAYQAHQKDPSPSTTVPGMNIELAQAFNKAAFYAEKTTMLQNKGEPYGVLHILAVHPDYHRRGIASTILKEGLSRMDSKGLPVYLDCGRQGKRLYERFGFNYIQDYPLDAREYGGRSEGKHWCMLRPAQKR